MAMTPDAIRAARRQLRLTQSGLAAALRLANPDTNGKRTIRNWETGSTPISGPASVALEAFLSGWKSEAVDPTPA
jgi:DNA-binding transcriptional regulator YiaG